jgi:hypothetical protein
VTHRDFPTAVIVSVCQNRLVCPFGDYRNFLNHATGANVPLWDVERARAATAKYLQKSYAVLSKVPAPPEKTDSGNAGKYVRSCTRATGIDEWAIPSGKVKFAERTLSEALK